MAAGLALCAAASSSGPEAQALDLALTEEDARALVAPYMGDLKGLDAQVVETVVLRQWWGVARDIVAQSHVQQVDLSFAVRKAVRTLKDEADELLRTLNPKYGLAQQVSPAFQWAQNDTSVFLTIKYTVRWNAPGALEVTEPSVNMTANSFNFSGLGKHSNNKYRYFLSLGLFDHIMTEQSSWSAASVGKLSVTLRKRWARKWPRLLLDKKMKIGNMHLWSERQENLDSTLSGMATVTNSPVTCAMAEKLYCLATDTCKKAANCSQCPGKTVPKEDEHMCTGRPTEKASLSFKDMDMDMGQIGGEVKITKAKNDFDIDAYEVYFGKDDRSRVDVNNGASARVGRVAATGSDVEVTIPPNTVVPESATHLLVFSTNSYGEYASPGSIILKDGVLPKGRPSHLEFEDEDGDKGEVSGKVTVGRADNEDQIDEYALHWGKSEKKKTAGSFIHNVRKEPGNNPTHFIAVSTKIPEGATHLLAFAKNEHGENPVPASLKLTDKTKPCLAQGAPDCPRGVSVSPDSDPDGGQAQFTISVDPAPVEEGLSHYSVYWGRQSCSEGGQSGAKNGYLKDVAVGGKPEHVLAADTPVPEGTTHILVFSKGKLGESDFCVSTAFMDSGTAQKPEL